MNRYVFMLTVVAAFGLSGCGSESHNPDVKIAEDAVGVPASAEVKKTSATTRDVTVVHDTKVIDNKTGQTISEKVESTPVKITEETKVNTDVNVKVGDTKSSVSGTKPPAAK